MLAGVVSKSINVEFLPSITSISLFTLSTVAVATVLESVDVNVTVLPAANVPVIPPKRILVFPSLYFPAVPSTALTPLFAKYVNEFNHSTLTPFVTVNASTPGVINVTLWNNPLASFEVAFTTLPSKIAPEPASA